jgi:hypothetical protein
VHVVSVKCDVEGADGERNTTSVLDEPPEPRCERRTPRLDPDEREALEIGAAGNVVPLDELVGDASEGFGDRVGVKKRFRRSAIGDVRGHLTPFQSH